MILLASFVARSAEHNDPRGAARRVGAGSPPDGEGSAGFTRADSKDRIAPPKGRAQVGAGTFSLAPVIIL
jgi:hypothetical protein